MIFISFLFPVFKICTIIMYSFYCKKRKTFFKGSHFLKGIYRRKYYAFFYKPNWKNKRKAGTRASTSSEEQLSSGVLPLRNKRETHLWP